MLIVGIDCATNARKVGLARADLDSGLRVREAHIPNDDDDLVDTVVSWLQSSEDAVLAIDAPLGWPVALGTMITSHAAGTPVPAEAHTLFRRATDCAIKKRLHQRPLDVGADRIARTAHAALVILEKIGAQVPVTLGWKPGSVTGRQVVEVYPAATLKAIGTRCSRYKKPEHRAERTQILDDLPLQELDVDSRTRAIDSDDVLDAVVCTVAGADFAQGRAVAPTDLALAKTEGWIWAR